MSDAPAVELRPLPARGRRYAAERRVRLGDVDAGGELRLDAAARYLQDVASDDALDAELDNAMGWLVRRTLIRAHRGARLNERVSMITWCTGAGRSWAERRTSIRDAEDVPLVDAVSLWVQIDPSTGRPARLGPDFDRIYGVAAAGRIVSSKLSLPRAPAPDAVEAGPWRFRATDRDPFGHVNNAAQWALAEDVVEGLGGSRRGTGELEYLAPADVGIEYRVQRDGTTTWLTGADGAVSVLRWTPA